MQMMPVTQIFAGSPRLGPRSSGLAGCAAWTLLAQVAVAWSPSERASVSLNSLAAPLARLLGCLQGAHHVACRDNKSSVASQCTKAPP